MNKKCWIMFVWFMTIMMVDFSFCRKYVTFDISYEIYDREIKTRGHDKHISKTYYLFCKNDSLGRFRINVAEDTYYQKKNGEDIKFKTSLTSNELYAYAVDKETKENLDARLPNRDVILGDGAIAFVILLFTIILSMVCLVYFLSLFTNDDD